jgi:vibriolysin
MVARALLKAAVMNARLSISIVALGCTALVACAGGDSELFVSQADEATGEAASDHLASDVSEALSFFPSAQVTAVGTGGVPTFVRGELGRAQGSVEEGSTEASLRPALTQLAPVFRMRAENLAMRSVKKDALAFTHVRYQAQKNGLEVVGGELVLHLDPAGQIFSVSGTARDAAAVDATPLFGPETAAATAREAVAADGMSTGMPRLVYLVPTKGELQLAWEVVVEGRLGEDPVKDRVYVNAKSGVVIERHPLIHPALSRKLYTAKNGTALPGTLLRSEGGAASADAVANQNYDHLGTVYACYQALFARDSINGAGLALKSSVHYDSGYNNAYWDGTQMVYGDGDGYTFGSFATSLDVTAHELTHGVTDYEAALVYQGEPGALNEAMSDVVAAACHAWKAGAVSAATWKLAEDVYTPGTAGDALRYMNNPTADGSSKDYYPERFTGTSDNGGVHFNSGIANLAFQLLAAGGSHPRGKTANVVPALGITKAGAIFYRALTQYMTSNSNFQATRSATTQAALDLYGAAGQAAVNEAWNAVGVPGGTPSGGGTTPAPAPAPTGSTALVNGVAKTGLAGAANAELVFTFAVPAGAGALSFAMSGGTGDADLYVKFGAKPTTSAYDYRPYLNGNNETATAATATAGTWYVMVRGYSAFTGISLVASYLPGSGSSGGGGGGGTDSTPALVNGVPVTNVSGAANGAVMYKFEVPAGASALKFQLSGGTGDADLYVKFGAQPTTTTYDYRPYLNGNNEAVDAAAQAGTWYVMVRGYSAFAGATLRASFTP